MICKDCPERELGCHATCGKYQTWKAIHDELTAGERALHHNSIATTEGHRIRGAEWERIKTKKMGGYCK